MKIIWEDFFDRIQYYGCLYCELAWKTTYLNSIRLNQKFWDSKKKSKFMSKINRKNNNNYSSK